MQIDFRVRKVSLISNVYSKFMHVKISVMPRCLQLLINENVCRTSCPWAKHKIPTKIYFQQRTEEFLYK